MMDDPAMMLLAFGTLANAGILTGIFFRLGRGAARMEELFRRVIRLEENHNHVGN